MNGAFYTDVYRNVFLEYGYAQEEIDRKVEEAFQTMFYGPEEERIYHPVEPDMGYMEDTGNHDARTEGMSYGMMMCVQMDKKEEFDRLWKWARTYMYMEEGENAGYFAWSCQTDGTKNAYGPAPDGEEYFAMALFFAANRWGNGEGIFDYEAQAKTILHDCIHKGEQEGTGKPMWDPDNHLIKFITECDFSDPSYHLPHFYELFALWADEEDRGFWKEAAKASRVYLKKACHPVTGLCGEYAEYDGTPRREEAVGNQRHDWYYSDAYRTVANIGLDYLWFAADEWECENADRVQRFFCETEEGRMDGAYLIDGTRLAEPALHPTAIVATNAQASLAAQESYAGECVRRFWETPLRRGDRRYYDNCLYFFALLALSGRYRIWKYQNNPILRADFPDPDVIRVGDTYYMVSTTMHFMPGGVILRSYDLIHWEIAGRIYEKLDSTPGQTLSGGEQIYGQGMWAPTFRYHDGTFYVCFAANDTKKTYLFTADQIGGPWKKQYIEGFYHDCSLLFDEDRVYIVYGNTEIRITELTADLKGPKEGGLNRVIIREAGSCRLGYEGSHIYKIHGKYYVFLIHSPGDVWFRTEACYRADSLEGEFTGGDVLRDDMNYCGQGVAQGGIVDTPEGDWYAILFQDRGAVGRIPVVVPVSWNDDFPVFGKVPEELSITSTRPDHKYEPLFSSDDFFSQPGQEGTLKNVWEFNHEPDNRLWSVTERPGAFRIRTGSLAFKLEEAVNTLTQRLMFPGCEITVTLDGRSLKPGDYAGLCALQGCFGLIAMTCEEDGHYLVMKGREAEDGSPEGKKVWNDGNEYERIRIRETAVTLKMTVDFDQMKDEAEFFYLDGEEWRKLGQTQKLYFKLDHFTGCRAGLFLYSTKQAGGTADFMDFRYEIRKGFRE